MKNDEEKLEAITNFFNKHAGKMVSSNALGPFKELRRTTFCNLFNCIKTDEGIIAENGFIQGQYGSKDSHIDVYGKAQLRHIKKDDLATELLRVEGERKWYENLDPLYKSLRKIWLHIYIYGPMLDVFFSGPLPWLHSPMDRCSTL